MLFLGLVLYVQRRESPVEPEPVADAEPRAAGEAEPVEEPLEDGEPLDLNALNTRLQDTLLRPLCKMRDEGVHHSLLSRARPSWYGAWDCDFSLSLPASGGSATAMLDVFARSDAGSDVALREVVRSFAIRIDADAVWLASAEDGSLVRVEAWLDAVRSNPWLLGMRDAELLRALDQLPAEQH